MKRTLARQLGLTLIELITTVAIISILVGLAVPAYDRYTRKSARSAGKAEIEKVRGLMESFYINNKSCTDDLTDLGYSTSPSYVDKTGEEVGSADNNRVYQISIESCANTREYTIRATPQLAQTKDTECGYLEINQLGQKSAEGTNGLKCW